MADTLTITLPAPPAGSTWKLVAVPWPEELNSYPEPGDIQFQFRYVLKSELKHTDLEQNQL